MVDGSFFVDDEEDELDFWVVDMEGFKRVFINFVIEEEFGLEWLFFEGCLSIFKICEEVNWKEIVCIFFYDENWNFYEEEFLGYKVWII